MSTYVYGNPRIGNSALAKYLDTHSVHVFRVVHWRDIVPHVQFCLLKSTNECSSSPTRWAPYHAGIEIFYTEDQSSYVVCDGPEDFNCSNKFNTFQWSVSDHLDYFGYGVGGY